MKVFPDLSHLVQVLDDNKAEWTSRFDEYEDQLKQGKNRKDGNVPKGLVEQYLPKTHQDPKTPTLSKKRSRQVSSEM